MEYSKLDAKLSEALLDPDDRAVFEVFIDLDTRAGQADLQRLGQLGVAPSDGPAGILTARLTKDALAAVSELPSVRQVTLRRRLHTR